MTKNDLFQLLENLMAFENQAGVKFNYAISRNIDIVAKECDRLRDIAKPDSKFLEYNAKRIELLESLADKAEDGTFVMGTLPNGLSSYTLTTGKEEFDAKILLLQEEYIDAISAQTVRSAEIDEFMQEESDLVLYTLKSEHIPAALTPKQIRSISAIFID